MALRLDLNGFASKGPEKGSARGEGTPPGHKEGIMRCLAPLCFRDKQKQVERRGVFRLLTLV